MPKFVTLKVQYEDALRKIHATDIKIEHGRLRIFDGEKLVWEFSQD
jgi:hypothetical protein